MNWAGAEYLTLLLILRYLFAALVSLPFSLNAREKQNYNRWSVIFFLSFSWNIIRYALESNDTSLADLLIKWKLTFSTSAAGSEKSC